MHIYSNFILIILFLVTAVFYFTTIGYVGNPGGVLASRRKAICGQRVHDARQEDHGCRRQQDAR